MYSIAEQFSIKFRKIKTKPNSYQLDNSTRPNSNRSKIKTKTKVTA